MPPSWLLGHHYVHPPTLGHEVSPQVHLRCGAPCQGEGGLYWVHPQQKSRVNKIKDVPSIPSKGLHLVVPQKLLLGENLLRQAIWVCSDPPWHCEVYAGIYVEAELEHVLCGLHSSLLHNLLQRRVILWGTHHLLKGTLSRLRADRLSKSLLLKGGVGGSESSSWGSCEACCLCLRREHRPVSFRGSGEAKVVSP